MRIDVCDVHDTLADDVRNGLTTELKQLPPKYFYDRRGSELFERITTLPEYYPSRCEREILNRWAPEIVRRARAAELVAVTFRDGEEMRTEISAKFTRDAVERELTAADLRLDDFFTDRRGLFALAVASPAAQLDHGEQPMESASGDRARDAPSDHARLIDAHGSASTSTVAGRAGRLGRRRNYE